MTRASDIRRERERLDCRYREVGELQVDPCVYCGIPATGWDHVPPLCIVANLSDLGINKRRLQKLPSCSECNSFLGASNIDNVSDRRRHVLSRLEAKYRHHLKMPCWDEDELAELGSGLAEEVRRHARFSAYIKQRTAWARRAI